MDSTPFYSPPELEPVRGRQEDFDLMEMPPGQGDLNFRPPLLLAPNQTVWALRDLFLVSLAAFPCGFLFRDVVGSYLFHIQAFLVVLLIAIPAGVVQAFRQPAGPDEDSVVASMIAWLFVPVVMWAAIALASLARDWSGALLYLLILPVPLTLYLADQLATHAVWWMSAHPRLDLATMLAWRDDWNRRFLNPPSRRPSRKDLSAQVEELHERVLRSKSGYRLALAILVVCIVGASAFASFFSSSPKVYEHGFGFFVGLLLGLFVACFLRTFNFPGAFGIFRMFFLVWVYAQPAPNLPPWGFRSPTIPVAYRLRLVLLCIFLWALALAMLTDHFAWLLLVDPHPQLRPSLVPNLLTKGSNFIFLSVRPDNAVALAYVGLAIAACVLVPILIFFLVLFLVTGSTLAGHFYALEMNDAYEQR